MNNFHIYGFTYYYLILIIFKLIYLTHVTGIIIPSDSGPWSNSNEMGAPYSPKFQNWNLSTKCNLVSCPEYTFFYRRVSMFWARPTELGFVIKSKRKIWKKFSSKIIMIINDSSKKFLKNLILLEYKKSIEIRRNNYQLLKTFITEITKTTRTQIQIVLFII